MEAQHVRGRERSTRRKSHLDFRAGLDVYAAKACRQRRSVVRNHYVAGAEQRDQTTARQGADATCRIHVQELRVRGALNGPVGSDHEARLNVIDRAGSRSAIASAISTAAALGCFSVVRSASGIASACIGVSMSPGSSASSFTPCDAISSFQMRVMCATAALLEPYAPQRP